MVACADATRIVPKANGHDNCRTSATTVVVRNRRRRTRRRP